MQRYEKFFRELNLRVSVNRKARPLIEKYSAQRFNVFNYIDTDERLLSRILADLLNPNGEHGQGSLFIGLFLIHILDDNAGYDGPIEVGTESVIFTANGKRRFIDILITMTYSNTKRRIAIENKPFAMDQPLQVHDYISWLNSNSKDYRFIYLTSYGQAPGSIGEEEWKGLLDKKRCFEKTYRDLLPWLEQCMYRTEAEKIRWFLNDFRNFIELTFGGIDLEQR